MYEIQIFFNAANKAKKQHLQEQAAMVYRLGQLFVRANCITNPFIKSNDNFPAIYEVFPDLYEKEKEHNKQQDWRIALHRMEKFTQAHNKLYNSKGVEK